MKTILEKAELKGDHIYMNDELVATKNMIGTKGEANAKRIVEIINMHDELIEALEQELEHLEEWNGKGNYTGRIEKLKELIKRTK